MAQANANAFDDARIGVDDLELVTIGMLNDLAAQRHTPGKHEQQAAHRIDIFVKVGVVCTDNLHCF